MLAIPIPTHFFWAEGNSKFISFMHAIIYWEGWMLSVNIVIQYQVNNLSAAGVIKWKENHICKILLLGSFTILWSLLILIFPFWNNIVLQRFLIECLKAKLITYQLDYSANRIKTRTKTKIISCVLLTLKWKPYFTNRIKNSMLRKG